MPVRATAQTGFLMTGLRLADQAYSGIVNLIAQRQLGVGDRLPSEARLAEMFGMSRSIIRESLVRLASDGITEARKGAGSFVKHRPSDRLIAYAPSSELSAILGTYEVRFVLESEAARLAAIRRSAVDLMAIEEALIKLREKLLSHEPAHVEDMELHRKIVQATANSAFLTAFEALFNEVDKVMRAGVEISRARPPEVIGAMMREHEAIVDAIRAQDFEGAALAMRWHLWEGRKRLMP